jgi:hypothetical protein
LWVSVYNYGKIYDYRKRRKKVFNAGYCGFVDVVQYQRMAVSVSVMVDQVEGRKFLNLSYYPIVPS